MPIYEYRCTACKHELEAIQKFSDAPLVTCPKCGAESLRKLLSAAGFHLKGSGWYQTDFRGSGSKPAAKSNGEEGGAGDSKAESKGSADAKSEATTPKPDAKSDGKAASKPEGRAESKPAAKPDAPGGSGSGPSAAA